MIKSSGVGGWNRCMWTQRWFIMTHLDDSPAPQIGSLTAVWWREVVSVKRGLLGWEICCLISRFSDATAGAVTESVIIIIIIIIISISSITIIIISITIIISIEMTTIKPSDAVLHMQVQKASNIYIFQYAACALVYCNKQLARGRLWIFQEFHLLTMCICVSACCIVGCSNTDMSIGNASNTDGKASEYTRL